MVVNNVTNIDKDKSLQLLLNTAKKVHCKKYFLAIFLIVCGLYVLINGLIKGDNTYIVMGSLFTAVGGAYTLSLFINSLRLKKAIFEDNKEVCTHGVTYTYKFKEQSINIICQIGKKTNKVDYKYTDVRKVVEYDDRYEISIVDNVVLYVDKSGFTDNKSIEFFHINFEKNKKKIKTKIKNKK